MEQRRAPLCGAVRLAVHTLSSIHLRGVLSPSCCGGRILGVVLPYFAHDLLELACECVTGPLLGRPTIALSVSARAGYTEGGGPVPMPALPLALPRRRLVALSVRSRSRHHCPSPILLSPEEGRGGGLAGVKSDVELGALSVRGKGDKPRWRYVPREDGIDHRCSGQLGEKPEGL
ncbi:hypothetical protein B0H19DRAFT_1059985 [Mycena capillaripes]|nr:hypothetical protein B0H19DRAFT_1059985 [Mycena capillaripes]